MSKIINFDDVANENLKKHKLNWLHISDHSYRRLIICGSGTGKKNHYLI